MTTLVDKNQQAAIDGLIKCGFTREEILRKYNAELNAYLDSKQDRAKIQAAEDAVTMAIEEYYKTLGVKVDSDALSKSLGETFKHISRLTDTCNDLDKALSNWSKGL